VSRRARAAAALLALAGLLVVAGVALWSVPAGLVVAGVLLGGWTAVVLVDVGPSATEPKPRQVVR
jgi:hypothetical protein